MSGANNQQPERSETSDAPAATPASTSPNMPASNAAASSAVSSLTAPSSTLPSSTVPSSTVSSSTTPTSTVHSSTVVPPATPRTVSHNRHNSSTEYPSAAHRAQSARTHSSTATASRAARSGNATSVTAPPSTSTSPPQNIPALSPNQNSSSGEHPSAAHRAQIVRTHATATASRAERSGNAPSVTAPPSTSTAPSQSTPAPANLEQLGVVEERGIMHITTRAQLDTLLVYVGKNLLLLEFHAKWCGACKTVNKKLEELARAYGGKMTVACIDVDDLEEAAVDYEVNVVPSFVMVREKEVLETMTGSSQAKLEDFVRKYGGEPTVLEPSENNNNEDLHGITTED